MRYVIISILALSFFLSAGVVNAQEIAQDAFDELGGVVDRTGVAQTTIEGGIGSLATITFSVVGLLFFALLIYGGISYMLARGDESQLGAARQTIVAAIIGLIVVLSSFAVATFVTQNLVGGAGSGATQDALGSGEVLEGEELQEFGCCLIKIQREDDGSLEIRPETWIHNMSLQRECDQFVPAPGSVIVEGPDFIPSVSAIQCREFSDARNRQ
jgi:hypothetical protein